MKKTLQLTLIATFFAACANNTSINSNPVAKTSTGISQNKLFQIDKIIIKGKTFNPKNTEEIPNISFDKDKFYGYSGCNRFFGAYQSSADILQIEADRAASTQMLCHPLDVMEFENAFLSNFKGKFKISYDKEKLVLSSDEMTILFK